MKMRTEQEWDEYIDKIQKTKCPEGWYYATEHGKYRVFVSKSDPTMFYLYKKHRFLFWTWQTPLFIFKA